MGYFNGKQFYYLVVSIFMSDIMNSCDNEVSVWQRTLAWNLSKLAIMWLIMNQPIGCSALLFRGHRSSLIFLQVAGTVSKLCKSKFCRHRNRSFRNALNNVGPTPGALQTKLI